MTRQTHCMFKLIKAVAECTVISDSQIQNHLNYTCSLTGFILLLFRMYSNILKINVII